MRNLIVTLLIAPACASPSPAIVARVEDGGFRECTVMFEWTKVDLVAACGEPDLTVAWGDGECAVYRTSAHSFRGERGAPYIAACMRPGRSARAGASRLQGPRSTVELTVVEVFGLAEIE